MIRRRVCGWTSWVSLLGLAITLAPAGAQSLGLDVYNSRREVSGPLWGNGNWVAFTVEEFERDLNRDGDADDALLCLMDLRNFQVHDTGISVDPAALEDEEDSPIAFDGDRMIVPYSEADNGMKDENRNGSATDSLFAIYDASRKQPTILPFGGRAPKLVDGRLYFLQSEATVKQSLNGDADQTDWVLCAYDLAAQKFESLGAEADAGYATAGSWIVTRTSEAAQGGKDLNGDGDMADVVAQVYSTTGRQWVNTGLDCSFEMALTPQLLAVAVDEQQQGRRDLNGDADAQDVVLCVWDLSAGVEDSKRLINVGIDCSAGLVASQDVVGVATSEDGNGRKDLNGDGDAEDDVVQCFSLKSRQVTNVARDGSSGIQADAGKIAFVCSEIAQGDKDQNKDKDADDDVLMVYDPAANRVVNTGYTVDGDLAASGGVLAWRMLEMDYFDRDINRDGDTDDSIVMVMNLSTLASGSTGMAGLEYLCSTSRGVAFLVYEEDQGRDLNGNRDTDNELLFAARLKR